MSNPNIPEAQLPAFPFACQGPTTGPEFYYSITIRDYFAAKAMQGMMASDTYSRMFIEKEHGWKGAAECAYKMADVMLAERSK